MVVSPDAPHQPEDTPAGLWDFLGVRRFGRCRQQCQGHQDREQQRATFQDSHLYRLGDQ